MIPEVAALDTRPSVIRIPAQIDVPVTRRVMRLIDTPAFQRLSRISQLGLVSRVYPGANHTRFEHSLGVYRNVLLFVRRLSQFAIFRDSFASEEIEALLVATLLHDIGHWPFCHPIEDMGLDSVPKHETVAARILANERFAELFENDWGCDPLLIKRIVEGKPDNANESLLCSVLSGPIDVDKMDYLYRDSLHCGVPYGMNFDAPRLINSICLNQTGDGIAISSKGKTAAEMMVFARYVMFSEVYWHHAVRSATAMLQRAFLNQTKVADQEVGFKQLSSWGDETFVSDWILRDKSNLPAQSLFGDRRILYKRLIDFSADQDPQLYQKVAHQPYQWLHQTGELLAKALSDDLAEPIRTDELLIDSPPIGLEVQFKVAISDGRDFRGLEEVSPVVRALAQRQFDDFVKKVRVFVHPRLQGKIDGKKAAELLRSCTQ